MNSRQIKKRNKKEHDLFLIKLEISFKEIKLMQQGKLPKRSWDCFRKEINNSIN